ncbi:Methyltransferase domain-containing protein [Aspergillus sp. HF37]|nr:Methyltransferase domain-containing protein [Aspergillus sp. HF37]
MTSSDAPAKDHWTSEAYTTSASFVPQLTHALLRYLAPSPTDRVLDIGCGDGKFTGAFLPAVGYVLGVDSSPAMIASAARDYNTPNAEFSAVDCRYLEKESSIVAGTWDKVYESHTK